MNKVFFTILLFTSLLTAQAFAQVPAGAPPGGGGFPGQGTPGGQRRPDQQPSGVIPGTTSDDQPRGNGSVSGVLVDSTSGKPVEFATVALINTQTSKPIDGTTTDDKGKFSLKRLAPGTYRLQYSFLGYRTKDSKNFKIDRGTDINMGNVKLGADVRTLNEVVVTGQAAVVEEKVDRLIYNAEKDITAKGGDATDIMRKVPMLSVDLDGNVSLRGSSNVRVLINNKPSTIVASSVADALKQIPADMIKTVEVITSPSAKYDAEGSGGIINIITKKNSLQGGTLNVDVGAGNRGSSLNLNGNYRQGKMGFSLGGFGRAMYNVRGAFDNTQTTVGQNGITTSVQTASTLNRGLFGTYQLGWDYDIDKRTSLAANIRYGVRNNITDQDNLLTRTYYGLTSNLTARNVRSKNLSGTVDANINYTKTYKPQQEFSVLAIYSRNNNTNDFVADLLNNVDLQTITGRQRNDNSSYNQESTLQIDYQTPIKSNQLLEFGGKGISRQVNSAYQYYVSTGANGEYVPSNLQPANSLDYNQNITAGYLSYTYSTKNKWTLKAGGRYEYTFIKAQFSNPNQTSDQTTDTLSTKIPNYGVFVPSINLSKSLKGGVTVKASYNRRIQRPGIQFLNPNINSSNPTNISQGNPLLSPELTNNYELGVSSQIKKVYVSATFFARHTANNITSVRDTSTRNIGNVINPVYQSIVSTTYQNIGVEDAYGTNLFANMTLFSIWQLGGGIDLYHTRLTNNNSNPVYGASNQGWVVGGRLHSSINLKNGWGFQAFGGGRGRQIQLQGYQGSFMFYNLGIKKDFKDKRGSIGLAAENFLNHPYRIRSESRSPILSQYSVNSMYNAGVRVNFSYRIGKMSMDGSGSGRRRKSAENDDLKSGGDESPQQQGGGQPQGGGNGGGGGRPRQ